MYIAQEDSPYVEPLGVKTQLGVDVTLEQLANAPDVWDGSDPPTIRKELTRRLDTLQQKLLDDDSDVKEQIQSSLSDARFIYIEDADPAFRSVTDVVWNGRSLGSYIVSVESDYGDYEELFNVLGIRDTIQVTDCLDYLSDTAWEDDDQRNVVWRRAIRKLVGETSEISSLQELSSEVQEKLSESSLLSLSNETVSLDKLEYYCPDETIRAHLRAEIADRVVKPYNGRDYTDETVGEVWELLGLTNIASDSTLSLASHNVTESNETSDNASDEFTQLFTVAYSFCLSNEYEDTGDELLRIHTDYDITVDETIECQYRFSNGDPITEEFEVRCYLDHESKQIRRTEDTRSLQEFTRRLPNELSLPPSEREKLESLLSGALGKRDKFLDSFLDTFEIEQRSIEEAAQSDGTSGESPENGSSEDVDEPSAPSDEQSGDGDSDDTEEESSVRTSSEEESKTTSTDSPGKSSEEDESSSADTTLTQTSGSTQGTSGEDTGTRSEDETSDGLTDQQSEDGSKTSEEKTASRSKRYTEQKVRYRDSEFRNKVLDAYDRACAVCGARRETKDEKPEVEAHHLKPVSDGGPDSVQNGIALCRLHHWAFEKGWIAVSDDYKVLVRDWEGVRGYEEFSKYEGKSIKDRLPDDSQQHPNQQYLRHHRELHNFEE
jgi:predicted restriction endonuclease